MQNIVHTKQGEPLKDGGLQQCLGIEHQLLDAKVAQLLVSSGAVIHVGDQVVLKMNIDITFDVGQ